MITQITCTAQNKICKFDKVTYTPQKKRKFKNYIKLPANFPNKKNLYIGTSYSEKKNIRSNYLQPSPKNKEI